MMNLLRLALRPALVVAACVSIAACANTPPRSAEMDYRTRSLPGKGAGSPTDTSDQRLTIQSGEGEKLNLPWFVKDTQDWVNRQ